VVAICTIACFAAVFGFALNQHGSEKSELEGKLKIRAGVSSKTPISAFHKLSTKSSLDEDAVDWAEEEAENKLIAGLEEKIRAKFSAGRTVEAQPLMLVNRSDVEANLLKKLDEQNFKTLVAKITGEMQAVNSNLDNIGALRKKQQDLEDAIASVTDDINSDETKELFDEIANEVDIVPAEETNGTLCGNGTNSSEFNCTGGNETVADDDAPPEEALAAVPAVASAAARVHAAHLAAKHPRAAAAAKAPAHAGTETLARHVELFEDVARVLQDEEHRVHQFDRSMKQLKRASGWSLP